MNNLLRALIATWREPYDPTKYKHAYYGVKEAVTQNRRICADELEAALLSVKEGQDETMKNDHARVEPLKAGADGQDLPRSDNEPSPSPTDVQLLAWAVVNCHVLARRALARSISAFDREKWEHVLRICEKAGARSAGVLRASLPTEITEGSVKEGAPDQLAELFAHLKVTNLKDALQSLRDIAPKIGIGHATLMRIETGQAFDAETLLKLWAWMLTEDK